VQNETKKVIIVDDNAANLAVGRNLLKAFYEVFPVPSAAKLFDVLEKFIPDLILLDVNMPEMNGYEAIKILKADSRFSDIPVIFLTAKSDEESEMEGFDLGAADYVAKPFSGPLLLRRIASQLLLEQQKRDLIVSREALQDYADNLEIKVREKTAAKTVFLANMSHELRTPMNSIVGFSELALDDDISQRTRGYLSEILDSSEWLLHIINDILDITSFESGKIDLNTVAFDLYELIEECKKKFMPKATENGLMLNFYSDPSIKGQVVGDPARLRQVLINLLSNAIKFTSTGVIDFQMDVRDIDDKCATVCFEVTDTGIGMTPEQIEIIYEPFVQVESGNTRKYGGTGLGLTITKSIVEMMGGKISVESTPGEGSKFSFELKLDLFVDEQDASDPAAYFGSKKPKFEGEILLCEDNAMNQQVACEHLARVGLSTIVAENGEVGVNLVRDRIERGEKQFDLIFMDIHMPVMDGLDATEEILKLTKDIPIVAMTANIMPEDTVLYIERGMKECLGKPFTSQELWTCLLRYFEPVAWLSDDSVEREKAEHELKQKLISRFVSRNKGIVDEFKAAFNSDDKTGAFMIAHTLKANAAQLGKTALQKAALDLEKELKSDEGNVTSSQIQALETELNNVIAELTAYLEETAVSAETSEPLDDDAIEKLLVKLEPLLEESDAEAMALIDELNLIPGGETLVKQLEDFDFDLALKSLIALKEQRAKSKE